MKLPLVGNVPTPVAVIGGVSGVVLSVYLYEKHKAASAQASSVADQSAYAYGYGYGYGSPAFTPSLVPEEYGYGAYGYGYYGYGGAFGGLGGYGSPYPVTGPTQVATTNAGWAEASEAYLVGQTGANPATVSDALGKYLTGRSVDANQQSIIEQAIAFEGYPPTPGTDNYPPNIKATGTTGQTGTSKGTKTVDAPGNQDLSQFAHAHNTTGGHLIALKGNKWLAGYYGNKRKIPKGYKITVSG